MTKKQLQPNAIVIGFRVPIVSNLPQRLKMVVRRTGLSYGELLERWVSNEESILGPLLFEQPQPVNVPAQQAENADARIGVLEKMLADLTMQLEASKSAPVQPIDGMERLSETSSEVASLKIQVSELTAKLEATLQALKPRDVDDLAIETGEEEPVAVSYEEIKLYILALGKTGMTVKEIAKYLNAKGVPTKSGVGQWSSTSLIPILKQAQMELKKGPVTEVKDGEEAETKVREVEDVKREADFSPDPPRRRGRSKEAKAETETLPEDTKDSSPSPSVADK